MSAPAALTPETLLTRIREDGVRRTAQALRKPPLPSTLLQALADLPSADAPEALAFVAAYPLSPSHLLEALAARNPAPEVLAHLATNPRTPPHLLVEFAAHPDASVRAQAALHPQLPARELLALVDDPDASVRRALATNSALRLPQQALLATDTDPSVRVALAAQSTLAGPAALVLAIDDSALVRLHAVASAPADDEILCGWSASDEEDVQLALLRRRNLPLAAERLLLQSAHVSVRQAVRERVKPDDVDLLNLATGGEIEERAWVAARPTLPRALQRLLAQDAEPSVRAALAANPRLDPAITAYFIDLADEPACVALAGNPAVSDNALQGVAATRHPEVLAALAYRENLDPALAGLLVTRSTPFRRHWAAQDRPLTGLDAETARTLITDPLPAIRALAVRGHAWRRADLYDLVRDPIARVRLAVVQHPHAPDELLADALSDPAPEVAAAARAAQTARLAATKTEYLPPAPLTTAKPPSPATPATQPTPPTERPAASVAQAVTAEGNLLSKLARLFR